MVQHLSNVTLSSLHRADGSATFSCNGYCIIGAVNGPIEVQRRDELPEEAAIDVVVRPAAGVGGVRERHIESIIQTTLRHVILISAHPRTLIQVTLQVVATPEDDSASGLHLQAASILPILPALLQTSLLALLSTSIPLSMTFTSTLVAVSKDETIVQDPSDQDLHMAASVHVLAFSSKGDLIVIESEGDFNIDIWEKVFEEARHICRGNELGNGDSEDISMSGQDATSLESSLREVMQEKVAKEQRWKESLA